VANFSTTQSMTRMSRGVAFGALTLLLPVTSPHAGMACWWDGVATCRVSRVDGATNACRTSQPENCTLRWDRKDRWDEPVILTAGAIYELPAALTIASGRTLSIEGSFSEPELRRQLASLLQMRASRLTRRISWFYMTDGRGGSSLDRVSVPDTSICVAVGGATGLSRIKVWECGPGSGSRPFLDDAFVPADPAIVVPIQSHGKSFAVVLMTRSAEADSTGSLRAGITAWETSAPANPE